MDWKKTLLTLLITLSVSALALVHSDAIPSSAAAGLRAGTYVGQLEGQIDLAHR